MSELDALTLARLQFAFTISFHIIFPAFTIGLASYLAVLETLWLTTGRAVFRTVFDFWKLPFAIAFGMGVVSGISDTITVLQRGAVLAEGPYAEVSGNKIPLDPWGEPYQYRFPGVKNKGSFDLFSKGPDKLEGTEDDIGNW